MSHDAPSPSAGASSVTAPPQSVRAAPVTEQDRILSLDVLRGVAILGILVMNIRSFSMPSAAYINPHALGVLAPADWWAWFVGDVLANNKFITIFTALFGAGILLFTERAEAKGLAPRGLHYRRMFWLLVFGLVHAYALWYGDILTLYATCGFLVYLLRRLSPRKLLWLGMGGFVLSSLIYLFFGLSMPYWPPESYTDLTESWQPTAEAVKDILAAYRGGWLDQMGHRAAHAFFFQTLYLLMQTLWWGCGVMLIGMALYKWGVLSAERSDRFYVRCILAAIFGGLPLTLLGVYLNEAAGWSLQFSFFIGPQFNNGGSLLLALGYLGLVALACRRCPESAAVRRLAAVGRMAFTNYIVQTLIATTLFYGHGFGLFGSVSRVGQLGIVGAIWVLQLLYSPWWLARFRFGPLEWLWRALTYRTRPPFRRVRIPDSPAV